MLLIFFIIIIALIIILIFIHPYSKFFFKSRLLDYKTQFEKTNEWKIEINPEINGEILYFLQSNGYQEIDYFLEDKKMINYIFPSISKDNHFLFVFKNRINKNIGGLAIIILLEDKDKNPIWYLDHIAINKKYRGKNYQTEIMIYIYQYFWKKEGNKNVRFLIQKAGKPSRFLFPYHFKTSFSKLNWNDINNLKNNDFDNISINYKIQNNETINNKLKNCYFLKLNDFNTYWFKYPLKLNKNKKRYELVFFENNNNPIKSELKTGFNKTDEFLFPKLLKNSINRYWYIYPFFNNPFFQNENNLIPLV